MASDVTGKAAPGSLWKPAKRQPKAAQPLKRYALPARTAPLNQIGKVGKERLADRNAKLKAEPARHDGKRQCYICLNWFLKVVLEHIFDASLFPELRSNPTNHKWSCSPCNIRKKRGTLNPTEAARVEAAKLEVEA